MSFDFKKAYERFLEHQQQIAKNTPGERETFVSPRVLEVEMARHAACERKTHGIVAGGVPLDDVRCVRPNGCTCLGVHVVGFSAVYWICPIIVGDRVSLREYWGDRCAHMPVALLPTNYGIGMLRPSDAELH